MEGSGDRHDPRRGLGQRPSLSRRALMALFAASPTTALAQPSCRVCREGDWVAQRPIRLVVPYAPGGSTDVTARLLAEAIGVRLGQPIVIENRAGAGGNIGAEVVARSAPDGHALVFTTSSTHGANPALYRRMPFDAMRDFAPVSQVAFVPNIFVVHPGVPANTLAEFIALARARPGALNYGTSGPGTSQHLAAALFAARAGIVMQHVPYRGGAPAVTDLLGGKFEIMASPLVEVIEHIRAGRLRPLAVTTARRAALVPDVPTVAETLPGYEVALWNGVLAPAGTPVDAVRRIAQEIQAALRTPELRERLAQQGSEPVGSGPEEFASFIAAELPKWAELVRISGASAD
ncbi:tripartite tricarboxylate transporter substrate binding protein [Roseomonas arctica]|uniref:Tripartite tricarboxylate transporter substrate binding protein n=2 Tax=Plastoroseomonas arctica TaxID=1509237 RepID=A0AAF1K5V2_9PROT|nr:tripartite tricarboxylate transporter substrate binding protein [Plastoroseomonas arctica]